MCMPNEIVEYFKLMKTKRRCFWESAMRCLLIHYRPTQVIRNAGIRNTMQRQNSKTFSKIQIFQTTQKLIIVMKVTKLNN